MRFSHLLVYTEVSMPCSTTYSQDVLHKHQPSTCNQAVLREFCTETSLVKNPPCVQCSCLQNKLTTHDSSIALLPKGKLLLLAYSDTQAAHELLSCQQCIQVLQHWQSRRVPCKLSAVQIHCREISASSAASFPTDVLMSPSEVTQPATSALNECRQQQDL